MRLFYWLFFLGLSHVALLAGVADAQGRDASEKTQRAAAEDSLRLDLPIDRPRFPQVAPDVINSSILDVPIDRAQYPLGPGDVVSLIVVGDRSFQHSLTVTPEGTIMLPALGVVPVLGLSLEAAEARARSAVLTHFRNVQVSLALERMRSFKVFVAGAVDQPGVRVASAATRVSEILPPEGANRALRRNVLVRRASGDTVHVDFARFVQAGDLASNPTLRAGDVIFSPPLDETVQVYGRVFFPGRYQYRPGETLQDLVAVANGTRGFPSDAADSVWVARFVSHTEREVHKLSRAEVLGPRGRALILQPFDAIFVPGVANYKEQKNATIGGQVVHPGTYAITPGYTTVRDLVAMAGGFTNDASLIGARLRRSPPVSEGTGFDLATLPPEFLTEKERRVAKVRALGDRTRVVLDFHELFAEGENALDQPLREGDELVVPRSSKEVSVLGAVHRPGVVQHVPGQGLAYFIALAGGHTKRADTDDVVVLKARSGVQVEAGDVDVLDPGDQIIVPFKEPRTFLQVLRDTNSVVSTVSGLVLTILALSQLNVF